MKKENDVLVHQMELGGMQNFQYFLGDNTTKEVALVDAGWEASTVRIVAESMRLKVSMILLTHGHYDHVNALPEILECFDVPVYLSEAEAPYYTPRVKNLHRFKDKDVFQIGSVAVECIHTPGHTPGCVCFYVPGHLLAGDTLFIDSCGRTDLPGGDSKTLSRSLKERIMPLSDGTIVYPGHNYHELPTDTLGNQKRTNPFLRI